MSPIYIYNLRTHCYRCIYVFGVYIILYYVCSFQISVGLMESENFRYVAKDGKMYLVDGAANDDMLVLKFEVFVIFFTLSTPCTRANNVFMVQHLGCHDS